MDEELLKRFTDCVYFLASPLTCKKGLDCEYRHCEIARLNPRDCWYWLAGSCLNPTCAFRHPPLDGLAAAATSESGPSTEPVNKTNVPCYFYFNGYCNKGDKCSFLHSIEADAPPAGISVKPTVANFEVPLLESNTFAGSDSGLARTNEHLNPSATVKAAVDAKVQPKEDIQDSELKDVQHQSDSPQISVSESEETTTVRSDSLLPARGSVQTASYESEEHSSGEQVEDQIDSEGRWESSPGFDVLVDGEYGNFDCEDDQEYILALDRGRNELKSHLLGYEVENPAEYDSKYHDMELHYQSEMYYPYDRQVTEDIFDDMRNIPGHRKAKMLDSILCHKRKLTPMELGFDNHRDVDLRDQLQRRRFIDGHSVTSLSRKRESSRLIDRSQDGPWRHSMGRRQLHGRLISEMGRNTLESLRNDQNYVNGGRSRGFLRHSQKYQPRKHFKEKRTAKRRFNSSEAPKKMASRERSAQSPSTFSRPKTLAQIREEKRKAENGDFTGEMRHSRTRRTTSTDFQGPRPLSEILKDKRKHTCESEAHTSSI